MKKSDLILMLFLPLFVACTQDNATVQKGQRWYTPSQVKEGKAVYEKNCINCHKKNAEGIADWKTPLADGAYPPPPLNGTAHTWHHALRVLKRTIEEGGVPLGGTMPGFKEKLIKEEKDAVIAYFQNFWSDEIYRMWLDRTEGQPKN
ncbi:MAG: cytochrome c [Nitrospirae bacterium]|nr:cytochrome c [Candidatus Manganitrophaceae bacterium]